MVRSSTAQRERRHYVLRSLLLLGFTLLLAKLIWSGEINLYLAPRLRVLGYVTAVILALLTISSFRQVIKGREAGCECSEGHHLPNSWWKSIVIYGMFALPMLMGFAMPAKILGSDMAEKRGLNLLSGDAKALVAAQTYSSAEEEAKEEEAAGAPAETGSGSGGGALNRDSGQGTDAANGPDESGLQQKGKPADEDGGSAASGSQAEQDDLKEVRKRFESAGFGDFYTNIALWMYSQPIIDLDDKIFLDGLTTLDLFPQEFDGHKLKTMGFVYRQPDFQPNQFVVARFSVSCCTADASVYGILVETEEAGKFATDSWVEVSGTLRLRTINDFEMLVLEVEQVKPAEEPDDPYVYFNLDGFQ
ncbi:MAG: TIGR03943 family protein [Brevibacillus sp.]|nr:TIGR03943 family protein [Brevibacillus sp.]